MNDPSWSPATRIEWGVRDANGRGKGNFHDERDEAERCLTLYPGGSLIRRVVSDWHDFPGDD